MFRIYTGRIKVESGHQTESVDSLLEREFERCILVPLSDQCILSILATHESGYRTERDDSLLGEGV